ncbi:unnamed protein product [Nesidiocoris tenuis]|uniref:Uncharacterized protein n=1 Tax=Nesidiocoris tenuis TaxID=355587 RepID=A0A6H5H680_9HEMI|nr:unnamed protein product [Nesidiocoris tenuis]
MAQCSLFAILKCCQNEAITSTTTKTKTTTTTTTKTKTTTTTTMTTRRSHDSFFSAYLRAMTRFIEPSLVLQLF